MLSTSYHPTASVYNRGAGDVSQLVALEIMANFVEIMHAPWLIKSSRVPEHAEVSPGSQIHTFAR